MLHMAAIPVRNMQKNFLMTLKVLRAAWVFTLHKTHITVNTAFHFISKEKKRESMIMHPTGILQCIVLLMLTKTTKGAKAILVAAWVAPPYLKKCINRSLIKSKTAPAFFYTAPILTIFRTRHFYNRLHKL